jgi:hypothetical protein
MNYTYVDANNLSEATSFGLMPARGWPTSYLFSSALIPARTDSDSTLKFPDRENINQSSGGMTQPSTAMYNLDVSNQLVS